MVDAEIEKIKEMVELRRKKNENTINVLIYVPTGKKNLFESIWPILFSF